MTIRIDIIEEIIRNSGIVRRSNNSNYGGWNYTLTDDDLNKIIESTVQLCAESICRSDPSPKMILHEPYRTIMNDMYDFFETNPDEIEK